MTLIDDATKYCYLFLLKIKDEALEYFKTYKAEVENQLEKKIKHVRSDRGGEYFSNEFDLFCSENGIIHERTPPYSSQSNGVAKRKNRMLMDSVNAMLGTSGMAKAWWGEAVLTACHVLNRVPAKIVISLRMKDGKEGNHHSITCVCGATWPRLAYQLIRNTSSDRSKTVDCILLGYAHHSMAYKFLVIKS
jgi:transposase InsO family protein